MSRRAARAARATFRVSLPAAPSLAMAETHSSDASDGEEFGEQFLVGEVHHLPLPSQATLDALGVPRFGRNKIDIPAAPEEPSAAPADQPAAPADQPAALDETLAAPVVDDDPMGLGSDFAAARDDPATFGGARLGIRDAVEEEPQAAQVAPAAPAADVAPSAGIGGCRAAYTHRIMRWLGGLMVGVVTVARS